MLLLLLPSTSCSDCIRLVFQVNGKPTCTNSDVNNKHYRETLQWRGFMVSDCGAISDIASPHRYAPNQTAGAADALNGGCDAACDGDYSQLPQALQAGLITEEAIDTVRMRSTQTLRGTMDSKIPCVAIENDDRRVLDRQQDAC